MLTELLLRTICWVLVPYEEERFPNVFVKLCGTKVNSSLVWVVGIVTSLLFRKSFPTEHFDSACQKRQLLDQDAQKNSASTAAMRKNMDAFLRKANKKTSTKENQSEVTSEINAAEEMTKKTADEDDSDRDLDLDLTL